MSVIFYRDPFVECEGEKKADKSIRQSRLLEACFEKESR